MVQRDAVTTTGRRTDATITTGAPVRNVPAGYRLEQVHSQGDAIMSGTAFGLGRLVGRPTVRLPPPRIPPLGRPPVTFPSGGGQPPSGGGTGGPPPFGGGEGGPPPFWGFKSDPFRSRAPVFERVGAPRTVIPDADPIFTFECFRKILEAYFEEHYYAAAASAMDINPNTPPQPKGDFCSNFGLVMATWEIENGKAQAGDKGDDFMQRVAEFKAWSPFLSEPVDSPSYLPDKSLADSL
jgi:hypothetical protein